MTNKYLRLAAASMMTFVLQCYAAAAYGAAPQPVKAPPVPPALEVPAGNALYLKAAAMGTQNYICVATDTGFTWKFIGPQATLFVTLQFGNVQALQQIATHFLSANPVENGTPRPTWQSSMDTSAAWAVAVAPSSDPDYVAAGAIPWLLLRVVGAQEGPTGGTALAGTTYIQRLNTSGGIAPPASSCSQTANIGATVLVPYTADYYFYKAKM